MANSPFKMAGFSGFGNSPLRQDKKKKLPTEPPTYTASDTAAALNFAEDIHGAGDSSSKIRFATSEASENNPNAIPIYEGVKQNVIKEHYVKSEEAVGDDEYVNFHTKRKLQLAVGKSKDNKEK